MTSWEESYIGRLRQYVWSRMLIMPGPRAFIRDELGRVLFIRRRDNGQWALPAGSMELGEGVFDALRREVSEETGLVVVSATLVAIYSGSRFAGKDLYGNEYQLLILQFRVDEWSGTLVKETDETVDAGFFFENELPEGYGHYREALNDLESFSGQVVLK